MTRIKICGLTHMEDIVAVNRCRPDYIGFVFAESRRRITPRTARRLKSNLDPRINAVGVFVNEPIPAIAELCAAGVIDIVQLHGDEDEEYIKNLRQTTAVPVIKALRVRSRQQILGAQDISCDWLLLDAYTPGCHGGSGVTFDRTIIPQPCRPFFLAGGLVLSNIFTAIEECRPYGIDLSSGVETGGRKDPDKIEQVVALVRRTASQKGVVFHV